MSAKFTLKGDTNIPITDFITMRVEVHIEADEEDAYLFTQLLTSITRNGLVSKALEPKKVEPIVEQMIEARSRFQLMETD